MGTLQVAVVFALAVLLRRGGALLRAAAGSFRSHEVCGIVSRPMPIHWTISQPDRLVVVICEGSVSRADIEAYLDNVVVAGALPYRKIFEARNARLDLSDDDMMALGARIQAYAGSGMTTGAMGPLALVAENRQQYRQARLYEVLAQTPRPLKIFRDPKKARQWLDSLDSDP